MIFMNTTLNYLFIWGTRIRHFEYSFIYQKNVINHIKVIYIKFKLIDVPGDGNCLYHSLVCSGVIERSSASLRSETFKHVLETWRNGCSFVKMLYASYSKDIPLSQYVQEQNKNGKWGSTLNMCFVSIAFGFNIVSVSNTNGGLKHFLVYDYFCTLNHTCDYVLTDAPTIWLYHHLYKNPSCPLWYWIIFAVYGLRILRNPFTGDKQLIKLNGRSTKMTQSRQIPERKPKIPQQLQAESRQVQQRCLVILMLKYPQAQTQDQKRSNGQLPI